MAARRRPAVPLGALLLAVAGLRVTLPAFVPMGRGRAANRTALRVNMFEGFQNLVKFGNSEPDPQELNTRSARQADESTSRVVEVNMPLGVQFEEKERGDIYIKSVDKNSDAWEQGVRPGAQLVMVSATFGDEMWNTRRVGMTQLMTVVNSRFGSTMKLALEKEDKNLLNTFFEAFSQVAPKESQADVDKKQKKLESVFEEEERKLKEKDPLAGVNGWNPFR